MQLLKLIIIGIIIIVIIVKIIEAGNNICIWVTPSICGQYKYFVSGGPALLS